MSHAQPVNVAPGSSTVKSTMIEAAVSVNVYMTVTAEERATHPWKTSIMKIKIDTKTTEWEEYNSTIPYGMITPPKQKTSK